MRTVRKRLIITAAVLLCTAAVLYGLLQVSKSRSFQFFGDLVDRVDTTEPVVALTFDDAPTNATAEVLETLGRYDVKGTFYALGSELERHPDLGRRIVAEGHELGNHTFSHRRMVGTNETPGFVRAELDRTDAAIRATGYDGPITFRPPYGKKLFVLPWELSRRGVTTVTWDVEPDTLHAGDADGIERYTVERTRPGSIVLLHPFCADECRADREALPRIIERLRADGFRFVTVRELLALR
ncbi:polysaccharide deacetylase family protein [Tsukamurella sp. M9C]|uniref:polysaccharide deacetylase family protein n=1 Tax=unclassified Tsukamurella TaxID=2633480 RepID=UPI001CCCCC71|nr:polysaccharide deacetylase family protein [Tsukamurella sp. M9C]MCA0158528.1 polysaccharide deacetylase family protein [Tsukamurella sp. M9C]